MSAVKTDFKRELHSLYSAARAPSLLDVPELSFLMIDGEGDPNSSPGYRDAVEALFSISYTVRFALKRAGVLDYGVMPLESLWWTAQESPFADTPAAQWRWTAMIMQPDELTPGLLGESRETVAAKHPLDALELLRLERFAEGRSAQVLHVGPYSEEGPTIELLHAFIADQGLAPVGRHHEIYLGDPRRSAPERLKTIIRQPVA